MECRKRQPALADQLLNCMGSRSYIVLGGWILDYNMLLMLCRIKAVSTFCKSQLCWIAWWGSTLIGMLVALCCCRFWQAIWRIICEEVGSLIPRLVWAWDEAEKLDALAAVSCMWFSLIPQTRFTLCRKSASGNPPIPCQFWCAGMLEHWISILGAWNYLKFCE